MQYGCLASNWMNVLYCMGIPQVYRYLILALAIPHPIANRVNALPRLDHNHGINTEQNGILYK